MTRDEAIVAARGEALATKAPVSVWRQRRQGRYISRPDTKEPLDLAVWESVITFTAQGANAVVDFTALQSAIASVAARWRAVQQIPGAAAVAEALQSNGDMELAFVQTALADAGCFISPQILQTLINGGK